MSTQGKDDEFQAQLQARIVAYWAQEDELRTRLSDVKRELEEVRRRREMAEGLYQTEFGHPLERQEVDAADDGELTGLTWPDAISRVLTEAGKPLHVKEIWEHLQMGGFWTGARDPLRSIVAVVLRDSRIERVGPNTYGFREVGLTNG